VRILICDDHAIFREGLKSILSNLDAELLEASSSPEAVALLDADPSVDVVLLDLYMPGGNGWTALRALRSRHPAIPVVIVSASEDVADARRALDAGASGYVPKSAPPSVFRSALQLVLDGSVYVPPMLLRDGSSSADVLPKAAAPARRKRRPSERPTLTARQEEVLAMMSRGLTNQEIGAVLGITEGTVKTHISAILEALDVTNRTEAVLVARDQGLGE
jgi:two-component system nitrate/nitrite response regulator NarL